MTSSPVQSPEEVQGGRGLREWHRPLALSVFLLSAWVVGPVTLVAVPFLLMVVGLPVRKPVALLLALLVLAVNDSPTAGLEGAHVSGRKRTPLTRWG